MNDSIIKLALSITLLFIAIFPLKKTAHEDAENDVSSKVENKITKVADYENYIYLEENINIIWNDIDMNDNVFPEGPSCKIDIY